MLRRNRNRDSCEKKPQERKTQESWGFLQEYASRQRQCITSKILVSKSCRNVMRTQIYAHPPQHRKVVKQYICVWQEWWWKPFWMGDCLLHPPYCAVVCPSGGNNMSRYYFSKAWSTSAKLRWAHNHNNMPYKVAKHLVCVEHWCGNHYELQNVCMVAF